MQRDLNKNSYLKSTRTRAQNLYYNAPLFVFKNMPRFNYQNLPDNARISNNTPTYIHAKHTMYIQEDVSISLLCRLIVTYTRREFKCIFLSMPLSSFPDINTLQMLIQM